MMFSIRKSKLRGGCPLCGDTPANCYRAPAVISPWIRNIGVKKLTSKYLHCKNCNLGYFSYRYTEAEMSLIYSEYRGTKYTEIRKGWEPWYSNEYNTNHDSQKFINKRRQIIGAFISEANQSPLPTVVDVGGDAGQYIPDLGFKDRYVLEASNKILAPGVVRIKSLNEVENISLIIYAHVLEHVPDPFEALRDLLSHAERVYIEVPFGLPVVSKERKSKSNFLVTLLKSKSRHQWAKTSKASTTRSVNPINTLIQSEHINFFDEETLQQIAKKLGSECFVKTETIFTPDFSEGKVIQCLLTRKVVN